MLSTSFDAVVLAGGSGRRLGGVDKAALEVAGATLLDRVLLASAGAGRTVVVGPPRRTVRDVIWTLEDPPAGGPLAGLEAGLRALCDLPADDPPTGWPVAASATGPEAGRRAPGAPPAAGPPAGPVAGVRAPGNLSAGASPAGPETARGPRAGTPPGEGAPVLVLATDLPWLTSQDVVRLVAALRAVPAVRGSRVCADAAVLLDAEGRRQPLAAAYRRDSLVTALSALAPVRDRPVRLLLDRLDVVTDVPDLGAGRDCDDPDQLAAARAELGSQTSS